MNVPTDSELLNAFRAHRDEAAFAELLRRHGDTVQAAARAVLGTAALAEDVVQAAFLTLARKGDRLKGDRSLGGWLYHLAVCLARNARRGEIRRAARHQEAAMLAAESNPTPAVSAAAMAALHEAIGALSAAYRAPLVLHYFEGKSYEAAAAELGLNANAFGVRLTRARAKLRRRLMSRGVTMAADGMTDILEESTASVVLPATLVAATCQAASLLAAGKTLTGTGLVSPQVAALTKSALKMLFWAKVKTAALATAASLAVVAGGGLAVHQALAHQAHVTLPPAAVPAQGGQVWAWGENQFGQLGNGTTNSSPTPMPVPDLDGVAALAVGAGHTLARKNDHTVWAWGDNRFAQLGDGTTTARLAPQPVKLPDGTPLANVTAVAAGALHSVVLTTAGSVWAWGDNKYGQLGDGTTSRRETPAPIPGLAGVSAVAGGGQHTVVLKADCTVWAWGANGSGQLGDSTTTTRLAPGPVRMKDGTPLTGVIAVAAGGRHTVALRDDHTVWVWGDNFHGQLGCGSPMAPAPVPAPVPAVADVVAVAAGKYCTLALKKDRTVWHWGNYGGSLLGRGPAPVKLPDGAPLTNVTAIAAGDYHAAALTADGGIWTWGQGNAAAIPVRLTAAVTALAAGGAATLVVGTQR